ncbi:hypothetical protein GCM10010464_38710 [Pseudonocardia yunnanensis]|uniref:Holin n=1 Tax=Pseudonocardia yunnanensis TaxID=58107 RepID=A0ABW4EW39_9PSEU
MRLPAPLANAIVVLVSLVSAGNFLASAFLPDYRSDSTLNFVFMTIVGGALALRGGDNRGVGGLLGRIVKPPPPPDEPGEPPPPERP